MARLKDSNVFKDGVTVLRASTEAAEQLTQLTEFYQESMSLPLTKTQVLTMIIKKDYLKNFKEKK